MTHDHDTTWYDYETEATAERKSRLGTRLFVMLMVGVALTIYLIVRG